MLVRPHERSSSIRRLGGALAIGCAVVVAALSLTGPGAAVIGLCYRFLEFYSGVFTLVALSLTVMGGLAATDRLLLLVRHRVLLQAVHRATAFTAVGFLVCHELTKLVENHASLIDIVVPFVAPDKTVVLGLGTIAGYALLVAAFTGIVRGRFAAVPTVWVWRAVHSIAYVAWPAALIHGLTAGRKASAWVVVSYAACAILVVLALLVRLIVHWNRSSGGSRSRPAGRSPGSTLRMLWQPVPAPQPQQPPDPLRDNVVHVSPADFGYGEPLPTGSYQAPAAAASPRHAAREWEEPAVGNGVFEAVPFDPNAHNAAASEPIAVPPRPFESVSDDEFWAYLRGKEPQ